VGSQIAEDIFVELGKHILSHQPSNRPKMKFTIGTSSLVISNKISLPPLVNVNKQLDTFQTLNTYGFSSFRQFAIVTDKLVVACKT
jgi:hypothetical protein